MSEDSFITWNEGDSGDKAKAFERFSDSVESYDGISRGSQRDFLNVEPNRSVRPSYTSQDITLLGKKSKYQRDRNALSRCAWTLTTRWAS